MSLMAAGKKIALTIHSLNMVYLAMSSTWSHNAYPYSITSPLSRFLL
jgi:hypothetical protein